MKRIRVTIFAAASICLHLLWATFFLYAIIVNSNRMHYDPWRGASRTDSTAEFVARYAGTLVDPIEAAAQLGRLDYISVALTFLGIVLAAGALAGFFLVRRDAIAAAEDEARKGVERMCPVQVAVVAPTAIAGFFASEDGSAVLKALFSSNPGMVYSAVVQIATVMVGDIQNKQANDIATAEWNDDVNLA